MSWPTCFLAVPTPQLKQDGRLAPTGKATGSQLGAYVQAIPHVYARLGQGASADEMLALRASPSAEDRALGESYFHLFSPDGRAHRIEAEYLPEVGLVVTRGRHRVDAARRAGIDHVPVHLRAPDASTLESLAQRCEAEVGRAFPQDVHTQRQHDTLHNRLTAYRTRESPTSDNMSPEVLSNQARQRARPERSPQPEQDRVAPPQPERPRIVSLGEETTMSFESPNRNGRPSPEHEPRPPRVAPNTATIRALGRSATSDSVTRGEAPRSADLQRALGRSAVAGEVAPQRSHAPKR